jgi:hypothetical protein
MMEVGGRRSQKQKDRVREKNSINTRNLGRGNWVA